MLITDEQGLRQTTATLVLDWVTTLDPPFTGETTTSFDQAITAAHVVADEARLSLHRWIDAARRTGMSWTEVGHALGISKQAAQQRFGALGHDALDVREGEEVVRIGATAFNEMRMLKQEGSKGNELVRTGALHLVFQRSDRAWEYSRQLGAAPATTRMAKAGWTYVSSWFPFHYFKRPIETAY